MMSADPASRLTAAQCLQHSFFESVQKKKNLDGMVNNLEHFNQKRKSRLGDSLPGKNGLRKTGNANKL